mgnify:FL=1|jgi:bacterial regulatory proteins, luxR family
MALYILNDPNIPMYIPLKTQYEISMIKALNRKRIPTKTLRQTSDASFMADDPQAVLLIPEFNASSTELILFCNKNNIPVIVLHSANTLVPFLTFSGIYGHSYTDERAILQYCIGAGKKRLALFGFKNVSPDRDHADAIYNIYPQFTQNDLFQRTAGFEQCFTDFFPRRYEYDAILCANDFIAACLLKKLKQLDDDYAKSRFIIGISNTYISKLFKTTITSVTYSRDDVVQAVAATYRVLLHNKNHLTSINYLLPTKIFPRESTRHIPLPEKNISLPAVKSLREPQLKFAEISQNFNEGADLKQLIVLENMFVTFDKLDFQILLYFMKGATNTEIANRLFITPQALQYHTRQMFEYTKTSGKQKFISLISEYISAENLESYISSPDFLQ